MHSLTAKENCLDEALKRARERGCEISVQLSVSEYEPEHNYDLPYEVSWQVHLPDQRIFRKSEKGTHTVEFLANAINDAVNLILKERAKDAIPSPPKGMQHPTLF